MMNKCCFLRQRHKKGELYYFCIKTSKKVEKMCYLGCLDKKYKQYKKLSQKTREQRTLEDERYSILQENLNKCFFCSNKATDWHELLKGRNRKKCIKWGLCVKVCRSCHNRTENDSEFYQEGKRLAQMEWQKYYNKSKEDFINEFGRNYLNENIK